MCCEHFAKKKVLKEVVTKLSPKYSISYVCRVLCINRSTYYYKHLAPLDDSDLFHKISFEFKASFGIYGTRKLKVVLYRNYNITVSRRRLSLIMKLLTLSSIYTRTQKKHSSSEAFLGNRPNLIVQKFDGYMPNEVMVGDVTYLRLFGHWYYLCTLLDLCGRKVIGYALGKNRDAELVRRAFHSYSGDLRNFDIFHYDRGSEASNHLINALTEAFGIKRSYSGKGIPYDNSVMESWHNIFKTEFFKRFKFDAMQTFANQLDVYINWYNNARIHGSLEYQTPVDWQKKCHSKEKNYEKHCQN